MLYIDLFIYCFISIDIFHIVIISIYLCKLLFDLCYFSGVMHQIQKIASDESALPGSPTKPTAPSLGSSPVLSSVLDASCPPVSLPLPKIDAPELGDGGSAEETGQSGASPHIDEPCGSSAHM